QSENRPDSNEDDTNKHQSSPRVSKKIKVRND
ncbi:unnamed protein product, partial [marine sediment metagenome]